jgi:hypothetical protein
VPRHSSDRLLRVIEIWVLTEWGRRGGGGAEEAIVFGVGDLCGGEQKRIDPDAMDGAFAILSRVGAHEEPSLADVNHGRFDGRSCSFGGSEPKGHCGCRVFFTGVKFNSAGRTEAVMAERMLRFKARIQGKEAGVVAAIIPPVNVREYFGTRGRVPIRGTINGFAFRSSLMPMGGCHMMPVNKALCRGAGVKPGDTADVVMERDEKERTVEAPPELSKELAKSKKARERWRDLSFTHKKEMAVSISGAKQEETRKRRLAKVMQVLKAGTKWTG